MKYFLLFLLVSSCSFQLSQSAQSDRSQRESAIIECTRTFGPNLYTIKHGKHLYVVVSLNGAGIIHSPECPCGRN